MKYFDAQIAKFEPLSEDDIKRLACKKNGCGGTLQPGDVQVYYIIETTGKDPKMTVHKMSTSCISEFSKNHEFIKMAAETTPVFRRK